MTFSEGYSNKCRNPKYSMRKMLELLNQFINP